MNYIIIIVIKSYSQTITHSYIRRYYGRDDDIEDYIRKQLNASTVFKTNISPLLGKADDVYKNLKLFANGDNLFSGIKEINQIGSLFFDPIGSIFLMGDIIITKKSKFGSLQEDDLSKIIKTFNNALEMVNSSWGYVN
ncbi:hypothetical protein EON71_00255 [bacterium]|nr:MAG: hypothetical protein EON71_00255 [bacterium]